MDFELDGQHFDWRADKAELNIQAHGVTFEEAAQALADPGVVTLDDPVHSKPGEPRYTGIGFTKGLRLLRVTFRPFPDNSTHIISAREASPLERRLYVRHNR